MAVIALGGNLNLPDRHIRQSLQEIAVLPAVTVIKCSSLYRSPPMDATEQPDYCNAVALLSVRVSAIRLLRQLHGVETAHGRRRDEHWAARTLDIDLIAYAEHNQNDSVLRLPHPGLLSRAFVIHPLTELVPDYVLPNGLQVQTAAAGIPKPEFWKS